jgi:hypothetical protein
VRDDLRCKHNDPTKDRKVAKKSGKAFLVVRVLHSKVDFFFREKQNAKEKRYNRKERKGTVVCLSNIYHFKAQFQSRTIRLHLLLVNFCQHFFHRSLFFFFYMSDDYADNASDYSDPLDSFQQNASGIEQSSDHSTVDQNDSDADSNGEDSVKEDRAREMYEESHPDKVQQLQGGREIALQEANWSVSSHRLHWGPEKLRDNNPLTYWQ